ncbi:M20/M25/M40 family metallo-hydrolase [Halanaerobiaceae bacterium Z-7014]|uniref:M20/M25/M40 family metallo-hydrolase n=1 Tax=Halonatronomonas betaini TaxID=2778430 RepID=A0A931AR99_9FIRM|nr:M20/M25/M40 family metallo-hydrolase [Halonatronomonas betaini]MBF8437538.1 M20/M25/M40 family metallo-hydrolase [Halonatronomonas betaini]
MNNLSKLPVDIFRELIEINSPSRHEGSLAARVIDYLQEAGLETLQDRTSNYINSQTGNIIGINPPCEDGLLLVAHLDRVEPGQNIKLIKEGRYLKSQGNTILGADNLAGISAILSFLLINKNYLPEGLGVLFTVAEELGLLGASFLPESFLDLFDHAIVLDGEAKVGSFFVEEPAACFFLFQIVGQESNASRRLNLQIARSTINDIGNHVRSFFIKDGLPVAGAELDSIIIAARGNNTNHLIRKWPDLLAHKIKDVLPDIKGEISLLHCSQGVNFTDEKPPWLKNLINSTRVAGHRPELIKSGDISEAGLISTRGLPAINIGTGAENSHTTSEKLKIEELANQVDILTEYIIEGGYF